MRVKAGMIERRDGQDSKGNYSWIEMSEYVKLGHGNNEKHGGHQLSMKVKVIGKTKWKSRSL